MKKALAILLLFAMLLPFAYAEDTGTMTITVPEKMAVQLYHGLKNGTKIYPERVDIADGLRTYTYTGIVPGQYRYETLGGLYYNFFQNVNYRPSHLETGLHLQPETGLITEQGFEQDEVMVQLYSQETIDNLLNDDISQWPEYSHVFTTPWFTQEHGLHQATSQTQLEAYLQELDTEDDDLYLYSAGQSAVYKHEIPVAVLTKTDLSGAETLEEAAALVRANGKTTIHIQGQIHGNEPAGGEGALAMLGALDGEYGKEVLEKVNVYVIPRINVDGAQNFKRTTAGSADDPNRDHLLLSMPEVLAVHQVYDLFQPQVTVDCHEFTPHDFETSRATFDDVQYGIGGSLNSSAAVTAISADIMAGTMEHVNEQGLRSFNYGGNIATDFKPYLGRGHYGLNGSLTFLIETRGIKCGMGWFARRVIAQYLSLEAIIDQTVEREAEIYAAVQEGRRELAAYSEYNADDRFALDHKFDGDHTEGYAFTAVRPTCDLLFGELKDVNNQELYKLYNYAPRSRPRPTAYVVDLAAAGAGDIIEQLEKHHIAYYTVASGTALDLFGYKGSKTAASLTEEAQVSFSQGALVVPTGQWKSNIVSCIFEPDLQSNGYKGNAVQDGTLKMAEFYCSHTPVADWGVTLTPGDPQQLETLYGDALLSMTAAISRCLRAVFE